MRAYVPCNEAGALGFVGSSDISLNNSISGNSPVSTGSSDASDFFLFFFLCWNIPPEKEDDGFVNNDALEGDDEDDNWNVDSGGDNVHIVRFWRLLRRGEELRLLAFSMKRWSGNDRFFSHRHTIIWNNSNFFKKKLNIINKIGYPVSLRNDADY